MCNCAPCALNGSLIYCTYDSSNEQIIIELKSDRLVSSPRKYSPIVRWNDVTATLNSHTWFALRPFTAPLPVHLCICVGTVSASPLCRLINSIIRIDFNGRNKPAHRFRSSFRGRLGRWNERGEERDAQKITCSDFTFPALTYGWMKNKIIATLILIWCGNKQLMLTRIH